MQIEPLRRILIAIFFVAMVSTNLQAKSQPATDVHDATTLRKLVGESQERIKSLDVCYRYSSYGSEFPPGTFVHRILKIDSNGNFLHSSAHGHDALRWQDDPLLQMARGNQAGWVHEKPVKRTYRKYNLSSVETYPGSLQRDFYFVATGVWPSERAKAASDFSLTTVAQSEKYSKVGERLVKIGDSNCETLIWPDNDILYLDVDRGYTLVQRELLDPNTKQVVQRFVLSQFEETSPNTWLPRRITYDENVPSEQPPASVEILSCKSNVEFPAGTFESQPLPGALVVDLDGSRKTTSGIEDHLDATAAWYQRVAPEPTTSNHFHWDVLHIAALCTFVVIHLCWLKR